MSASEPTPSPDREPLPSKPGDARPDWLVGAEEGAQAETRRGPGDAAEVTLHRPAPSPDLTHGAEGLRSEPAAAGLPLSSRAKPAPAPPPAKGWTAKSSSVPRLALVPSLKPAGTEAGEDHEDDLDRHDEANVMLIGAEEARAERTPVAPLDEPWWIVIAERLATDRRLQLVIVSVIALITATVVFWPREGKGVAIGRIRRHPEAFANQTVRVHGEVEEVFPLGEGWVFDLRQGRDTITVFTRGLMPQRHARVEVVGLVSTGYLDGRPRTAILEGGQ